MRWRDIKSGLYELTREGEPPRRLFLSQTEAKFMLFHLAKDLGFDSIKLIEEMPSPRTPGT